MSYEDRVREARSYSTDELRHLRQLCTELTCLYHGPYNQVLHERGEQ